MTFEDVTKRFSIRGLHVADVQHFLDAGGDINQQDARMHWTLLHFAAESCNDDALRLLVSRGANLGIKDVNGWTALHLAVDSDLDTSKNDGRRSSNLPTARLLIELGADETMRNLDGCTARDIAKEYGQESLYNSISLTKGA